MSSTISPPVRTQHRGLQATLASIVAGAVVGVAACAAIAGLAHAMGVFTAFQPLQFASYTALVVIATIAGAIGWKLVQGHAARPARTLTRLVPAVVVVSMTPDVLVGVSKSMPHTSWAGVITLMLMHLAVSAALVASYSYFWEVRSRPPVRTAPS